MITRRAVTRGSRLRAALHLAAALLMVAGLGVVATQSAAATKSHSKSVSSSHKKSSHKKSASPSHKKSVEKVNINTAPLKDLEELPGVGTVMAQRIIAGRPYKTVQDLRRAGVPPQTVRRLLTEVTTGRATAPRAAESPRASATPSEVRRNEAPSTKKSPTQRTFFGIPIGGVKRTAQKAPAQKVQPAPAAHVEATERVAATEPPAEGMVWADPDMKTYYQKGDHRYGTTRHGRYLWEDQAIREGYRAPTTVPKHSK